MVSGVCTAVTAGRALLLSTGTRATASWRGRESVHRAAQRRCRTHAPLVATRGGSSSTLTLRGHRRQVVTCLWTWLRGLLSKSMASGDPCKGWSDKLWQASPESVAVVTGGNKGIGFNIVKQLALAGVSTTYLTARDGRAPCSAQAHL